LNIDYKPVNTNEISQATKLNVSPFDFQNLLQRSVLFIPIFNQMKCIYCLFFEFLCIFVFYFRQYFELENLRKRHLDELKSCMQMLRSENIQPTILYEALSPLSNTSKYKF